MEKKERYGKELGNIVATAIGMIPYCFCLAIGLILLLVTFTNTILSQFDLQPLTQCVIVCLLAATLSVGHILACVYIRWFAKVNNYLMKKSIWLICTIALLIVFPITILGYIVNGDRYTPKGFLKGYIDEVAYYRQLKFDVII